MVLTGLRLVRPRCLGNCWLGCLLWEELGLSDFWDARLNQERGDVPWRKVLDALSAIHLVDLTIPTTDGQELVLPRYTEPAAEQAMIQEQLRLTLPPQPPPRIRAGQVELPAHSEPSASKM